MRAVLDVTESLQSLYEPIDRDLTLVQETFDAELAGDLPFIDDLCATVRSYRGKMLRPALLLLFGKATSSLRPAHTVLAAVVEMVHMATLVHDDVLDEADRRRRQPTINRIAGNVAAVLLGDFLISHAFHLCSSLDSQHASRLIGATTNAVCEGELLQNHHRGRWNLTRREYMEIIQRKTASLTAACCELGVHFAGGDRKMVAAAQAFGQSAGIAFQIVDDVLDLVGDDAVVGKTLGTDALNGKVTLPVIHCLENSDRETQERVKSAMGAFRGGHVDELRECLLQTNSIEFALTAARSQVALAREQLEAFPPSPARSSLNSLSEFIVERRV